MKVYKLIDSKIIDYIITDNSSLTVRYESTGESIKVCASILSAIYYLVEHKLIDLMLARELVKGFPLLIKEQPLTFSDFKIKTPFTCYTDLNNIKPKNEMPPLIGFDRSSLYSQTQQINTKLWQNEKLSLALANEKADLDQVIITSLLNEEHLEKERVEKARSLSLLDAPDPLLAARVVNARVVSSIFLNTAISNSRTQVSSYPFFKLGTEVQIAEEFIHQIYNVTCKFKTDNKGISLTISCDDNREILDVSPKQKNSILLCKSLSDLGEVLAEVKNGDCAVNLFKPYIESEQLEENNDLEQYNV